MADLSAGGAVAVVCSGAAGCSMMDEEWQIGVSRQGSPFSCSARSYSRRKQRKRDTGRRGWRDEKQGAGATDFHPSSLPLCHSLPLLFTPVHDNLVGFTRAAPHWRCCCCCCCCQPTQPTELTHQHTHTRSEDRSVFLDAFSHSWKLDGVRIMCVDMQQFFLYLSLPLSLWIQTLIRCPAR